MLLASFVKRQEFAVSGIGEEDVHPLPSSSRMTSYSRSRSARFDTSPSTSRAVTGNPPHRRQSDAAACTGANRSGEQLRIGLLIAARLTHGPAILRERLGIAANLNAE
jgi:hypothetical protein